MDSILSKFMKSIHDEIQSTGNSDNVETEVKELAFDMYCCKLLHEVMIGLDCSAFDEVINKIQSKTIISESDKREIQEGKPEFSSIIPNVEDGTVSFFIAMSVKQSDIDKIDFVFASCSIELKMSKEMEILKSEGKLGGMISVQTREMEFKEIPFSSASAMKCFCLQTCFDSLSKEYPKLAEEISVKPECNGQYQPPTV